MSGETPAGPFGHALARLREAEQQMQAAVKLARAVIHALAAPLTPRGVWVPWSGFRGRPLETVVLWVWEGGSSHPYHLTADMDANGALPAPQRPGLVSSMDMTCPPLPVAP